VSGGEELEDKAESRKRGKRNSRNVCENGGAIRHDEGGGGGGGFGRLLFFGVISCAIRGQMENGGEQTFLI